MVSSSCPFCKHIQKYLKAPPTPCLQPFKLLFPLVGQKLVGRTPLRRAEEAGVGAPPWKPRGAVPLTTRAPEDGVRELSLPGELSSGLGRLGPVREGSRRDPLHPESMGQELRESASEWEESEVTGSGFSAPVLLPASVHPLKSQPRASPPRTPLFSSKG